MPLALASRQSTNHRGWYHSYAWWISVSSVAALSTYAWLRPIPLDYTSPLVFPRAAAVVAVLGSAAVLFTWLRARPGFYFESVRQALVPVLLLISALTVAFIASFRGESQGRPVVLPVVWATVVLVLLFLFRPPTKSELGSALKAWTWAVALVALVDLVWLGPSLASAGPWADGIPFRFDVLSDLTGLEGRWSGPFPNTHIAGIVAAWLVVFSLVSLRWSRILLLPLGLVCLVLSESRSGLMACVFGVALFLILAKPRLLWIAIPGAIAVVAAVVAQDPDGNGRLGIAGFHLRQSLANPLVGDGSRGVGHAHNTFLDIFSRYGLVAGVCFLTAVLLMVWRGFRLPENERRQFLPVLIVLIVGFILDTAMYVEQVGYLTVPLLLLALTVSGRPYDDTT